MKISRSHFRGLVFAAAAAATFMSASAGAEPFKSADRSSVYLKAGLLGAGVGYAHGINEKFTLRGEFTTMGTYSRTQKIGSFDYDLRLKNNVGTVAMDFFPFNNGFRLTAGVGLRDTRLSGQAEGEGTIQGVQLSSGDSLYGKVKWPTVAPYLGIGWGHNNGQSNKGGWGFVADAGVYFGRPDVSLTASPSAMAKFNAHNGGDGQALLDKELGEWEDKVRKYKVFPALYVGVSYRF